MDLNLRSIRQEYTKKGLSASTMPNNPFLLFEDWLQEAIEQKVNEPTAVLVGTVSPEGFPSTRTVLLKELRNEEFIFYTNYNSRKVQHLSNNPAISLTFVWHELERQVHIEGFAHKIAAEISDEYFHSRPYKSQIGARISPQSYPIPSRFKLMREFVKESAKWAGREIERPDSWGGYSVKPNRIEFWQGRPSRLHDRFLYKKIDENSWKMNRLAP